MVHREYVYQSRELINLYWGWNSFYVGCCDFLVLKLCNLCWIGSGSETYLGGGMGENFLLLLLVVFVACHFVFKCTYSCNSHSPNDMHMPSTQNK